MSMAEPRPSLAASPSRAPRAAPIRSSVSDCQPCCQRRPQWSCTAPDGRTRCIILAETVRALGLPNPVAALENGTQGLELAGYRQKQGNHRPLAATIMSEMRFGTISRAAEFCQRHRIPGIDAPTLAAQRSDSSPTVYILYVHTP